MDNRWIWILLFCLAVTLAAWELRDRNSREKPEDWKLMPTIAAPGRNSVHEVPLFSHLRIAAGTSVAKNREKALALALRKAYGSKGSWKDRALETIWLTTTMRDNQHVPQSQLVLGATALPHDGLLALFTHTKQGHYVLEGLLSDLARVEEVKAVQVVGDNPQELAVTQSLDQLIGAFFRITALSLVKWSDVKNNLVPVFEYPLELEEYDIGSNFDTKITRRSDISFDTNLVTVYEVSTTWQREKYTDGYYPVNTSTKKVRYIWDPQEFAFVPDTAPDS